MRVTLSASHHLLCNYSLEMVLVIRFEQPKHIDAVKRKPLMIDIFVRIQLTIVINNLEKRDLTRSHIAIDSRELNLFGIRCDQMREFTTNSFAISYAKSQMFRSQLFRFNKQ